MCLPRIDGGAVTVRIGPDLTTILFALNSQFSGIGILRPQGGGPPQNPGLPPARPINVVGTPPPPPTVCGVNPVTGAPGFTRNPMGVTGNMRTSRGGDGWFGAARPRNTPPRHSGIDIAGVLNTTPVVAFLAGTVTFAGHTPGDGGTLVNIDHGGGITSSYVHLQQGSIPAGVAAGQAVSQGNKSASLAIRGMQEEHLHIFIFGLDLTEFCKTRRFF